MLLVTVYGFFPDAGDRFGHWCHLGSSLPTWTEQQPLLSLFQAMCAWQVPQLLCALAFLPIKWVQSQ